MGHVMQGVVPALVGRELLLRTSPLQRGKWLFFLVCALSLAISACYEFIEWWAALINEQAAESFLGTQGDHWDTQWDMFLALSGSIIAQLLFARNQDRQLTVLLNQRHAHTD
jgi:putative membrane protein